MTQIISAVDLQAAIMADTDQKRVCVDVRTEVEHDAECIAGSINIPLDQLQSHLGKLRAFDDVYVYCASGNRSAMACDILQKNGFARLYDLADGLNGWKLSKLSTIGQGRKRIPLMQQVLIVVGTTVMGSIILGYTVHDLFLLIPLMMSIGLLYAGFSGNCLMTKVLIKMPWNRRKE
ncbi:MAG: rhodanese-like domain-containing protein [Parcubacteria group bacterium]|jgi:rhodanese-related sulfurtransferase